jgi:signal transduction histidine kinase
MTLVKELDKLLKLIVHIITKTIRLKYVAIYIFDKNTDTFNLKARRGQPVDVQLAVNTVSPLLKFVLNHKRPITQEGLEGVYADKDKIDPQSLRQEMKSMGASVLVPSIVENQLLAFLVLGEKVSGQHYTEDDLNVFSILANQASLAIENAIFYEETGKTMAEKFREHRLWSLGKMGSGIGHQINNRFAVITFKLDALRMIEVEKLKNTNPTTDQKKLIKTMEDSLVSVRDEALRGGEIATTLTSFARDTSGFKGIPLEDVIKGATNLLSCKFNITELNLEVNLPPHAPPVLGNLSQLQDVFMNIMDNAHDALLKRESEIEAGNPKAGARFTPKVAITGHVKGNRWHIEIKDNGIGMKEDELKQLFIPFFTTKASSEKGTGLGLSIIKQIIDAHKGTVTAESAYGQGTTFFINLPLFA